jgi:hypothetical protein
MGSKKRRRNGGRVNKRRSINDVRERYSKKSPFSSKVMLKAWDFSKTVNQNYENIGLLGGNLNDLPRRDDHLTDKGKPAPLGPDSILPKKPIQFISGVMASNMPSLKQQLDARSFGQSSRGKYHMTELEIAYIEPLIEKYGIGNWFQMSKDMTLNYKQETRDKLKRRCLRYEQLRKQQREEGNAEEEESEESEESEENEEGSGNSSSSSSSSDNDDDDEEEEEKEE